MRRISVLSEAPFLFSSGIFLTEPFSSNTIIKHPLISNTRSHYPLTFRKEFKELPDMYLITTFERRPCIYFLTKISYKAFGFSHVQKFLDDSPNTCFGFNSLAKLLSVSAFPPFMSSVGFLTDNYYGDVNYWHFSRSMPKHVDAYD